MEEKSGNDSHYGSGDSLESEDEMSIYPLGLEDIGFFSRSLSYVSGLLQEDTDRLDFHPSPRISSRAFSEGANNAFRFEAQSLRGQY